MPKIDKYIYSAKLVRVVDGDTCDAMIDLGFDTSLNELLKINGHAYEYHGEKKKTFHGIV